MKLMIFDQLTVAFTCSARAFQNIKVHLFVVLLVAASQQALRVSYSCCQAFASLRLDSLQVDLPAISLSTRVDCKMSLRRCPVTHSRLRDLTDHSVSEIS